MLRLLRWALAAALLGLSLWLLLIGQSAAARPMRVEWLYDRILIGWWWQRPQAASALQPLSRLEPLFRQAFPQRSPLDRLDPAGQARFNLWLQGELEVLRRFDRDQLGSRRQLSYDIIEERLAQRVDAAAFPLHGYAVTAFDGPLVDLVQALGLDYPLDDRTDARQWLVRAQAYARALDQALDALEARAQVGLIPPAAVVDAVVELLRGQTHVAPAQDPLALVYARGLRQLGDIDASARDMLNLQMLQVIADDIIPARLRILDWHLQVRSRALQGPGAWQLPQGDIWYDHRVRLFSDGVLGADSLHEAGLEETRRCSDALARALDAQGLRHGALSRRLSEFRSQQAASLSAQTLPALILRLDQLATNGALDWRDLSVVAGPEWRQPMLPGPRLHERYAALGPARIQLWLDTGALDDQGAYARPASMMALGYGGLVRAAALRNVQRPRLQRWMRYPAWEQGWALHAIQMQSSRMTPPEQIGVLEAELLALTRLVVDTGMHRRRWSFARASEHFVETLGYDRASAEREVQQLAAQPGQALSAAAGLMFFNRLRSELERRSGATAAAGLDARLIALGPMPLPRAQQLILR